GPPQRIEPAGPDESLEDLLGQPGPLDDIGQAPIWPARELPVQAVGVLFADPLDQAEPESDAPAGRALGRPATPGLGRRDDAGGGGGDLPPGVGPGQGGG